MSLTLIGTGVAFDLTLSAIDSIKSSDETYIETYTNPMNHSLFTKLESLVGKKIIHIPREKVESKFLIEKAKTKSICLLCSGDPMMATTHVTLLLDAKTAKVETKIIHNSSIFSVAMGKSGLQAYRFGKTATLVNPRENYKPSSSLQIIRDNQAANAHTLVLLDTEPQPMEAKYALEVLREFDSAIVISKAGYLEEKMTYGKISDLIKRDLGIAPFCIIIPAKLHLVEEEYLENYKN
ncbi:MAG: diphthine synthase [Candidatus Bilamarchaeum sp.]|jgi:diphthine synthase